MQKVDHLEEEHPNCTDTTYEFSLSSEVPTGMLYDLVIEQVTSEDVILLGWLLNTRSINAQPTHRWPVVKHHLMKQLLFFNKHHLICSISCGTTTSISTCRTTASHTIDEHLNIALWNAYPFFQCCVVLCKVRRILTALPKHVQSDSNPGNMLANPWCWAAAQFFEMNTNQLNEFQLKFVIFLFWPPCL